LDIIGDNRPYAVLSRNKAWASETRGRAAGEGEDVPPSPMIKVGHPMYKCPHYLKAV
jgi:hypothetical protein